MTGHAVFPLWETQNDTRKIDTLRMMVDELYRYTLRDSFAYMRFILSNHHPADEKEATDIHLIQELMDAHATIFSALCEPAHFTGSALVMNQTDGRILLHHHRSLSRWLQFGGHPAYETDMAQVALREATEESGLPDLKFFPNIARPRPIDIDVHTIPATNTRPEHLHLDLRYVLTTMEPDAIQVPEGESRVLRWFSASELQQIDSEFDDALKRLISKTQQLFQEKNR